MALVHSPKIVTDNLVFYVDAGNTKSYTGSGATWTDISGNGNNVTLENSPTFNSGNGGYLNFNGSDERGYGSVSLALNNLTFDIVYSVPSDATGWRDILGLDNGSGSLVLELGSSSGVDYTNGYARIYSLGDWTPSPSADLASADQYIKGQGIHRSTATFDGTTAKSYINGVLQGSASYTRTDAINRVVLADDMTRSNRELKCDIYCALLYNRALTAAEIKQNYDALKGRYGL